jgi:hydroxymethylbilane synthase
LARWQAEHVVGLLREDEPGLEAELVVVETQADRRPEVPIAELGGKGVFAKEVQTAVLEGRADVATHSAKDLPSVTPDGLVLASVPERGDPRDALVGAALTQLRERAVVGTGALRRRAQLAHVRPDLRFEDLRGNIATRLRKGQQFDAIVLAAAALDRLDESGRIAERLSPDVMLPQVGQGALAVECGSEDTATRALLARIEHAPSRQCVDAERGFLAGLGGDCSVPAGAHAVIDGDQVRVEGVVASPDGRKLLRHEMSGPATAAAALGHSLASHLLHEQGGAALIRLAT